MKLVLLASGKLREEHAKLGAEVYTKRISKLAPFEVVEVPESRGADPDETGKRLLSRIKKDDRVALLADGGREYTSEEFARKIGSALGAGRGRFVFVIGGPFGVGKTLSARADEKLSLGRMTLPHELARVVLLEQIYRAMTIIRNLPYHHGG